MASVLITPSFTSNYFSKSDNFQLSDADKTSRDSVYRKTVSLEPSTNNFDINVPSKTLEVQPSTPILVAFSSQTPLIEDAILPTTSSAYLHMSTSASSVLPKETTERSGKLESFTTKSAATDPNTDMTSNASLPTLAPFEEQANDTTRLTTGVTVMTHTTLTKEPTTASAASAILTTPTTPLKPTTPVPTTIKPTTLGSPLKNTTIMTRRTTLPIKKASLPLVSTTTSQRTTKATPKIGGSKLHESELMSEIGRLRVALGVISAALALVIIALIIYCIIKRRRKELKIRRNYEMDEPMIERKPVKMNRESLNWDRVAGNNRVTISESSMGKDEYTHPLGTFAGNTERRDPPENPSDNVFSDTRLSYIDFDEEEENDPKSPGENNVITNGKSVNESDGQTTLA